MNTDAVKNAPVHAAMIVLRPDLTVLVTHGDVAIEAHLDPATAGELAIELMCKLLAIAPQLAEPLADRLWRLSIDRLNDGQLAAIVEQPVRPAGRATAS